MNDVEVTGGERIGLAYVDLGANIQPMQAGLAAVTGLLNAWVVRTQADMDTAMRNIWTIVDTSEQGLARYQQQIVQLSRTVPQSQKQLAEGFYQLLSASIDAADAMYVLEVAAKAASAGMASTYTAVDAITTVINAYGIEASKAGIIADIMFKTVEKGKITFEQLAGSMGGVISTAAASGVSFEEVAGAFATMTRTGISADEAATALNSTLMQLISPSNEAGVAAKELGIEWNLSALESKGLVGILQDLATATGGNAELISMFVPNIRAMKGVLNLTRNDVKDFAADVEIMNNALGKADEAFAKQADSINNSFQLMKNAMSEWGISMGRSTEPAVRSLASAMTNLSQRFSELPSGTQRTILAVSLATTSFGVLQKAVGGLVSMFSGPAGWIALIGAAAAAIVTIVERHQKWNEVALQTADKQKSVIEKLIDSADKTGASAKKLEGLIGAYEKLSDKTKNLKAEQEKLADKSRRLKEAQEELAAKTGLTKDEQEKLRSKTAELRDVEVDLKDKTVALKDEQAKLNEAAAGIGKIAPGVVAAWDDMGRAISVNLDGAKEKLANLYEAQAIYLRAAQASNEKSIQAMRSDIIKADEELDKLNKDYSKIAPLYNLGQLIQADKAGWDARREGWAKELEKGGYRYESGVKVSNLTYDDLIKFMADGSKTLEKAMRDALAYLETTSYKDYPYISINDMQREALAKLTAGDKIIDRQAQLLSVKVELAKLELDAETLRIQIKGLEESVTTLGKKEDTGTGGGGTPTPTGQQTTDKMNELNRKIDAILEPFTYKDKSIGGLELALRQLASLLDKYPTAEKDLKGEYHDERLAIKQAQYALNKDLQAMLADQAAKVLTEKLDIAEASSARIIEAAQEYVDIISGLDVTMLDKPAIENLLKSISSEREKWGDLWTEGIPGAAGKLAQKAQEATAQLSRYQQDERLKAAQERLAAAKASSNDLLERAQQYIDAVSGIDAAVLDKDALANLIQSISTERQKWGDLWTEGIPGAADVLAQKSMEAAERLIKMEAEVAAKIPARLVDDAISEITARIQKGDINQAFIENAYKRMYDLADMYGTNDAALQGKINSTILQIMKAEQDVADAMLKASAEKAKSDAEAALKAAADLLQANLDASMSEIEAAKIAAERLLYDASEALSKQGTTISEMQAWYDKLGDARPNIFGNYVGASKMVADYMAVLQTSIDSKIKEESDAQIAALEERSKHLVKIAEADAGALEKLLKLPSTTSGDIEAVLSKLGDWLNSAMVSLDLLNNEQAGSEAFIVLSKAIDTATASVDDYRTALAKAREDEAKAQSDKDERNWLEFVNAGEAATTTVSRLFDLKTATDEQLVIWLKNVTDTFDKFGSALVQSDSYEQLVELEKSITDELKTRAKAKDVADFDAYLKSNAPDAASGEMRAKAIADTVRSMLESTDYGPAMAEAHRWLLDGLLAEYAGVQEVTDIVGKVYADIDKRMDTYYDDLIAKAAKADAELQARNKEAALGQFEAVTNAIMEQVEKYGWNADWAEAWQDQLASILSSPYGDLEEIQGMVQKAIAAVWQAEDTYWADDARRRSEAYEQKLERLKSKYERDTEVMMKFVTPFLETDLEGLSVEGLQGLAGTGQWLMDTFRDLAEGFGVMPQIFAKYYAALQKVEEITGIIADETYGQKLERLKQSYDAQIAQMEQFTKPFLETDISTLTREQLGVFVEVGQILMDEFRELAEGAGIMEELFAKWYEATQLIEQIDIESLKQRRLANAKQVADAFDAMTDGLISIITTAYDGGYSSVQDALADIRKGFTSFSRTYWQKVWETAAIKDTSLDEAFGIVGKELSARVSTAGDLLINALQDVGKKLQQVGSGEFVDLGNKLVAAGDKLGGVFADIGKAIGDPITQLMFSVFGLLWKLGEWINSTFERNKGFFWDAKEGSMKYRETRDDGTVWEYYYKTKQWKQVLDKEDEKRAAFQISEISGPMRDTIVTALDPLKILYNYPTYKDEIIMAINSVREAILGSSALGAAAAQAGIQQYFSINTINITAANGETFSEIMMDLDKQIRLAEAGVGG